MKLEKLFQVLSIILRPILYLLAFIMLPFLLMNLLNPTLLLGVFIFICVIIYITKSTQFYRHAVIPGKPVKARTKDWIKVNAFVTALFVLEILYSGIIFFFKKEVLLAELQTMLNMIQDAQGAGAVPMTAESVYRSLKAFMIFFLVIDVLLATHIICSFKLLKKYKSLFI